MGQRMTWAEMKKKYPNEWLLVTEYEMDRFGNVSAGVVERHSMNKDDVYQLPALEKDCAFEYTGESTFRGFRDHVEHHCF